MHIIPSPSDPIVVLFTALVVVLTGLFAVGTAPNGRERTLRLLFLYLTYGVLEIVVKRGAHYAWYLYLIKFGLFFSVLASWSEWRRRERAHLARAPLRDVLGAYLALAAIQVFNPYQGNVVVGALGWLSDFVFASFYFVAFDLFDAIEPVRRFLRVTAVLGVLSAIGCFTEQWLGPNELMKTYPAYVRLLYYGPDGIQYRPVSLSAFNEIFGIAAMLGLMASRQGPVVLLAVGIAACTVANILHAVRIAWMTGFAFLALFSLLNRRRRLLNVLLVAGSIALAVDVGMDVTDGLIAPSLTSATRPLQTFEDSRRLAGLMAMTTVVRAFPFGVGVGESSAGLRLIDSSDIITFSTHNYLTELAAQMSLIGPLLLLTFSGRVVIVALRVVWRAKPDEWRAQVSVGVALFGALAATFFGGGGLGAYPVSDYFWLTAGAAMSLVRARRPLATVATAAHLRAARQGLLRPTSLRPAGPRLRSQNRPSLGNRPKVGSRHLISR